MYNVEDVVKISLWLLLLLLGIRYIIAPDKISEELTNPEYWPEDPNEELYPYPAPDWSDFHVHEDF